MKIEMRAEAATCEKPNGAATATIDVLTNGILAATLVVSVNESGTFRMWTDSSQGTTDAHMTNHESEDGWSGVTITGKMEIE